MVNVLLLERPPSRRLWGCYSVIQMHCNNQSCHGLSEVNIRAFKLQVVLGVRASLMLHLRTRNQQLQNALHPLLPITHCPQSNTTRFQQYYLYNRESSSTSYHADDRATESKSSRAAQSQKESREKTTRKTHLQSLLRMLM